MRRCLPCGPILACPTAIYTKARNATLPHRCCPGRRDDFLRLVGGSAAEGRKRAGSQGVLVDQGSPPVDDTLGSTCFSAAKHGFELESISPPPTTQAVGAHRSYPQDNKLVNTWRFVCLNIRVNPVPGAPLKEYSGSVLSLSLSPLPPSLAHIYTYLHAWDTRAASLLATPLAYLWIMEVNVAPSPQLFRVLSRV